MPWLSQDHPARSCSQLLPCSARRSRALRQQRSSAGCSTTSSANLARKSIGKHHAAPLNLSHVVHLEDSRLSCRIRCRTTHLLVLIHHRKLRLSNKKVQDELVNVSGGLEFLQAVGFQLVFDEADGYGPLACVLLYATDWHRLAWHSDSLALGCCKLDVSQRC